MFLLPPEDTTTVLIYPSMQCFLRLVLALQQSDPEIILPCLWLMPEESGVKVDALGLDQFF